MQKDAETVLCCTQCSFAGQAVAAASNSEDRTANAIDGQVSRLLLFTLLSRVLLLSDSDPYYPHPPIEATLVLSLTLVFVCVFADDASR